VQGHPPRRMPLHVYKNMQAIELAGKKLISLC